jgi:hypothetical protein
VQPWLRIELYVDPGCPAIESQADDDPQPDADLAALRGGAQHHRRWFFFVGGGE